MEYKHNYLYIKIILFSITILSKILLFNLMKKHYFKLSINKINVKEFDLLHQINIFLLIKIGLILNTGKMY
jgi:hypothetical protein